MNWKKVAKWGLRFAVYVLRREHPKVEKAVEVAKEILDEVADDKDSGETRTKTKTGGNNSSSRNVTDASGNNYEQNYDY